MLPRAIKEVCYDVAEKFVPYSEISICGETFRVPFRLRKWWFKEHEADTMAFVRLRCKPGMTFIDIGAHFGIYTITAARRVAPSGKVISFEPCARTRELFRAFTSLNRVTGVELREEAVSNTTGVATLFNSGIAGDPANTLVAFEGHPNQALTPTLRLDDLEVTRCDLIKMDAEGAEISIFEGATNFLGRHRPEILLSVHPRQIRCSGRSLKELWDAVSGLGFTTYEHEREVSCDWFQNHEDWFDVVLIRKAPSRQ
jgi:FkbM family methyltransferase